MLQTKTIEPGALSLLKKITQFPELNSFSLVGGTALALYYGHRSSVDLDFFSTVDFSNDTIIAVLEKKFKGFVYRSANNPIGVFGFIDNIKVDFVKHHHHVMIEKPYEEDGLRLFSKPDIIAMKISAILRRAVKKDFFDMAEILRHYSVKDIIGFHDKKYPTQQLLISIPQAITYFDDAEESEEPRSLKGQTWESVKKTIQQKVSDYLR